jgi:hypothetical protein
VSFSKSRKGAKPAKFLSELSVYDAAL